MTVTAKPLIGSKFAEATATPQYTAPTGTRSIIDKFTATNISASAATLSVHLIPSGGSVGDGVLIVKTKTLGAAECYTFPEIVGHVLSPGDSVVTTASAANAVTIRCSGREVT